jgi:linoleoyl-CoA desaturase
MRDKHLHIPQDSALLKEIYAEVGNRLIVNTSSFYRLLWLKFIFYGSATILCYFLLYQLQNPFLFILCYVFYGYSSLLLAFNFAHDLSHDTIFKSKRWNNLSYTLIYSLVGAHAEAWKKRHVHSHHYAPNVEAYDSDLQITSLIRVVPHSKHYWFHKYQPYYAPLAYTTYSLYWIFIKDFVLLFSKEDWAKHKGIPYHASFWMQKMFYIIYILVLPLMYSYQPWYIILIGFVWMHLSQSLFLLFTFFMTHHVEQTTYPTTDQEGFIDTSWVMNQIKSSNDMHPFSRMANFILGGFNNHIAHHLFPHIHHIYYPSLNKILYEILHQHGITPNQTTYWGGVVSHLKLLKQMSKASIG